MFIMTDLEDTHILEIHEELCDVAIYYGESHILVPSTATYFAEINDAVNTWTVEPADKGDTLCLYEFEGYPGCIQYAK